MTTDLDLDDDDDPVERYAPAGFEPFMQFSGGETREQALREAARVAGVPVSEVRIALGYFDFGADGEGKPVFQPFGWMVFVRRKPARPPIRQTGDDLYPRRRTDDEP